MKQYRPRKGEYIKNLHNYLAHIGVVMRHTKGGQALIYADAAAAPPVIKGDLTFGKLKAALGMWPQLRDVVSRSVLVGSLIGIDVPGGDRIYPRE